MNNQWEVLIIHPILTIDFTADRFRPYLSTQVPGCTDYVNGVIIPVKSSDSNELYKFVGQLNLRVNML